MSSLARYINKSYVLVNEKSMNTSNVLPKAVSVTITHLHRTFPQCTRVAHQSPFVRWQKWREIHGTASFPLTDRCTLPLPLVSCARSAPTTSYFELSESVESMDTVVYFLESSAADIPSKPQKLLIYEVFKMSDFTKSDKVTYATHMVWNGTNYRKYLNDVVFDENSSCMAIVPVFSDGRLHLLFHSHKFTIFTAQVQQHSALGWPICVVAVAGTPDQAVWRCNDIFLTESKIYFIMTQLLIFCITQLL